LRHNSIETTLPQKLVNPMKKSLSPAFWIELVLALVAALSAALTVLMPDWIEQMVPVDLDHHSGLLEWQLTAALFLAAALLSASAFREWRKALRPA
jgi:membrane protein implicated in regulation of membrane protease activity